MRKKPIYHPFRDTFLTIHHLKPKVRLFSHTYSPQNKLMLWRDKHNIWHIFFKVLTLQEIINQWNSFERYYNTSEWKLLFHNLSFKEAKNLLKRVARIKRNIKKS